MVKESTLKRATSLFGVIVENDISVNDIRDMSLTEYNSTFNKNITKESSLKAQKRLLNVIQDNLDDVVLIYENKRKSKVKQAVSQFISKDTLEKGKAIFEPATKTKPVQKRITPAVKVKAKSKFMKKVDKAKQIYGISEKEAIKRVRSLLRIPRQDIDQLSQYDKEIIYTV